MKSNIEPRVNDLEMHLGDTRALETALLDAVRRMVAGEPDCAGPLQSARDQLALVTAGKPPDPYIEHLFRIAAVMLGEEQAPQIHS